MYHILQQFPTAVLWIVLAIEFLLGAGLLVFVYIMISPLIKGAPNFPSQTDRLPIMLEFANLSMKDKVVDLGSGNGTILFAVAQRGIYITGIEIDPFAVRKSRKKTKELKLGKYITIKRGNFWRHNFSPYNVVFVYGINYIMKDLEKKLLKELKPGSRIISNRYELPNLKPKKKKNFVSLYIV